MLSQLRFRFTGLNTVSNYFRFLILFSMILMTKKILIKSTYDFIEKYSDDISGESASNLYSKSIFEIFFISKGGITVPLKK